MLLSGRSRVRIPASVPQQKPCVAGLLLRLDNSKGFEALGRPSCGRIRRRKAGFCQKAQVRYGVSTRRIFCKRNPGKCARKALKSLGFQGFCFVRFLGVLCRFSSGDSNVRFWSFSPRWTVRSLGERMGCLFSVFMRRLCLCRISRML